MFDVMYEFAFYGWAIFLEKTCGRRGDISRNGAISQSGVISHNATTYPLKISHNATTAQRERGVVASSWRCVKNLINPEGMKNPD
jgi:hypothetical protein